FFFFSSRRRHTRSYGDWSSDVCSSDLVYDAGGVGSVAYSDLEVEGGENRFVETEGLPRDSRRIDTTWLHPNKKGGPDRRFANNRSEERRVGKEWRKRRGREQ